MYGIECYRFLYKQGFKRVSSVCPESSWTEEDSFRNRIMTNIFSFVLRSNNFNPNFPNRFIKLLNVGSRNRDLISAIHISPLQSAPPRGEDYFSFVQRHASRMKLRKFVPIRLRQNIATSMESSSKGTDAMSQTSTSSFTFTKSKLRTLTFLCFWKYFANAASPQPKSATLKRLDFADVESRLMNISMGLVGQDWT
jgi:hypothetical protein